MVKDKLETGQWPSGKALNPTLKPFKSVSAALTLKHGLLMFHERTYMPEGLRQKALQELHEGHPGIERLKRLLRQSYWWPGMSSDAETYVKSCTGCCFSEKSRSSKPIPVGSFPVPENPGELYNLDIAGPFHNGQYLVVLIDAMSNYPEILDTKDITSTKIIKWLKQCFNRYGLPAGLITDNGPQFISDDFKAFLKDLDIHHHLTPVYYPQENGRMEVFNRTLKYGVQAAFAERSSWEEGVEKTITSFRHTPAADGKTPAEKFLKRKVRRPGMINLRKPDRRVHSLKLERGYFHVGDQVLVRIPQVRKGLPPFSGPIDVTDVLSFYTFRLADGKVYNARRLKLFKRGKITYYESQEEEYPKNKNHPSPRRSSRSNKGVPPVRYGDWV